MFTFPFSYFDDGDGFTPLGNLVPSCVCDLDATIEDSFSSGQKWLNIEPTPADGSSKTQNDYFFGEDGSSSTDDPTHTGLVGDPAAYMLMDGGDFFTHTDGIGASNVPVIRDLGKNTSGVAWWIAIAMKTVTLSNTFFFGNSNLNGDDGIRWFASTSGTDLRIDQFDGTGSVVASFSGNLLSNTDQLVIFSSDMNTAGGDNVRVWRNTSTKEQISKSWNSSSNNSNGVFRIGATDSAGTVSGAMIDANSRIYAFSYGNALIDDSDVALIKAEYESRHERTYDT